MIMRWTQEAGAEMRSVFLWRTKTADATTEAFVALKLKYKKDVKKVTIFEIESKTYNVGLSNSTPSGAQIPRTNLSAILIKASPFPLTAPIMIMTRYAFGKSFAAWPTPSWTCFALIMNRNKVEFDIDYIFGIMLMVSPVDFFQRFTKHFDRYELHYFISKVERQIENNIPEMKSKYT